MQVRELKTQEEGKVNCPQCFARLGEPQLHESLFFKKKKKMVQERGGGRTESANAEAK